MLFNENYCCLHLNLGEFQNQIVWNPSKYLLFIHCTEEGEKTYFMKYLFQSFL